jgi:ferredoxin
MPHRATPPAGLSATVPAFCDSIVTSAELRVRIDTARCQGHGRCAIVAPEVFDVDDLGKGRVLLDPCPEEFRAVAEEAEFSCPETAIAVCGDPSAEVRR